MPASRRSPGAAPSRFSHAPEAAGIARGSILRTRLAGEVLQIQRQNAEE